jgi:hypothetical protein
MAEIRCMHCSRLIRNYAEHSEMCPNNYVNGIQISHSVTLAEHMQLEMAQLVEASDG